MCNVSPDISFLTSIIETSKGLYMHQLYSVKSGKHQEWLLKSEIGSYLYRYYVSQPSHRLCDFV